MEHLLDNTFIFYHSDHGSYNSMSLCTCLQHFFFFFLGYHLGQFNQQVSQMKKTFLAFSFLGLIWWLVHYSQFSHLSCSSIDLISLGRKASTLWWGHSCPTDCTRTWSESEYYFICPCPQHWYGTIIIGALYGCGVLICLNISKKIRLLPSLTLRDGHSQMTWMDSPSNQCYWEKSHRMLVD